MELKYSVDKIKFHIRFVRSELVQEIIDILSISPHWSSYISNKMTNCHFNYRLGDGEGSIYFGVCPNWVKEDKCSKDLILEYNPNKSDFLLTELSSLLSIPFLQWEVMKVDIACDFFYDYKFVRMSKRDKREYFAQLGHSDIETRYLGALDCEKGHVKLYNKALERKLDIDWTRFEITIKKPPLVMEEFEKKCVVPVIFLIDTQFSFDFCKNDSITRIALNSIIDNIDYLYSIDNYRTRKKYEKLLYECVKNVGINSLDCYKCYIEFLENIKKCFY